MRTLLSIGILFLVGCASYPASNYNVEVRQGPDTVSGMWTSQPVVDPFNQSQISTVKGESLTPSVAPLTPIISVQGKSVYMSLGDGFICNTAGIRPMLKWTYPSGDEDFEEGYAMITKDRKFISWPNDAFKWNGAGYVKSVPAMLFKLNQANVLEVKVTDACGTTSIARFNITGTHHYSVTEIL